MVKMNGPARMGVVKQNHTAWNTLAGQEEE